MFLCFLPIALLRPTPDFNLKGVGWILGPHWVHIGTLRISIWGSAGNLFGKVCAVESMLDFSWILGAGWESQAEQPRSIGYIYSMIHISVYIRRCTHALYLMWVVSGQSWIGLHPWAAGVGTLVKWALFHAKLCTDYLFTKVHIGIYTQLRIWTISIYEYIYIYIRI